MTSSKAVIIAILGVLILSPDAALIRLADTELGVVMQWRGFLAAMALFTWLICRHGFKRTRRAVIAAGGNGWAYAGLYALSGTLFVYAASTTTVANTLFILATMPVFAALFARLLLGQNLQTSTVITMGFVGFGIALIAFDKGGASGTPDWRGDSAALTAAIGLGLAFTLARRAEKIDLVPMVGLAGLLQCVVALALTGFTWPPMHAILPIAVMGLVSVPLAFALITTAARHLAPVVTGLIMLLEAVFGPLIVWVVLGEAPGVWALAGGMVILSSLTIAALAQIKR